jgi:hypothetical protein
MSFKVAPEAEKLLKKMAIIFIYRRVVGRKRDASLKEIKEKIVQSFLTA